MIAIRIAMILGGGGIYPSAEDMYLEDGNFKIYLAGKWLYQRDFETAFYKTLNYRYYPSML